MAEALMNAQLGPTPGRVALLVSGLKDFDWVFHFERPEPRSRRSVIDSLASIARANQPCDTYLCFGHADQNVSAANRSTLARFGEVHDHPMNLGDQHDRLHDCANLALRQRHYAWFVRVRPDLLVLGSAFRVRSLDACCVHTKYRAAVGIPTTSASRQDAQCACHEPCPVRALSRTWSRTLHRCDDPDNSPPPLASSPSPAHGRAVSANPTLRIQLTNELRDQLRFAQARQRIPAPEQHSRVASRHCWVAGDQIFAVPADLALRAFANQQTQRQVLMNASDALAAYDDCLDARTPMLIEHRWDFYLKASNIPVRSLEIESLLAKQASEPSRQCMFSEEYRANSSVRCVSDL